MIITTRKFILFVIIAAGLNVVVHLFYLLHPLTDYELEQKIPKKFSGPYKRKVAVSMNWKILYKSIVCNVSKDVTVVELEEEMTKENIFNVESKNLYKNDRELCPPMAPDLGPVAQDRGIMDLHGIDDMYLRIQPGGIHKPGDCIAEQQVAIIVAVHETNSSIRQYIGSFIYYIHPFLMKQQLEYQIFVVIKDHTQSPIGVHFTTPKLDEKNNSSPFERGKLFNIGYVEAQTYRGEGWDCIIFHDAYLLPLDTRNLYRCSRHPKKLITEFQKPFRFGGAIAIHPIDFTKVNGFSNLIWSNDDDYIDMYKRLLAANLSVEVNVSPIGNYTTFDFLWQTNNESEQVQTPAPNYLKDGLSNLFYKTNTFKLKQFYTLIEVDN